MALEFLAGTAHLRLEASHAQASQQLRPGLAGKVFQVTTEGRGAFMICDISNGETRGNHTKARIKGGEFAQERLEGRLTHPSLLRTRRILERLQAIQNKQGWMMCDELRQSFALLPRRSKPWIWISKPVESRIKKFIRRRSVPTAALSVEGPTKNQLCRTIMVSSHPSEPMVNECGLSDTGPGNDCNDIDILVGPSAIQKSDILFSTKNITSGDG